MNRTLLEQLGPPPTVRAALLSDQPGSYAFAGPWRVWSMGFPAPGQVGFIHYDEESVREDQFRVATLYTGLSAGTELTFYRGTNPYLHSHWDDEYRVFGPGEPSQRYPVEFVGYMEVGQVIASRSRRVAEGDIVAMTYGHKTGHTANAEFESATCLDNLDPVLGIYVAQMGPICLNGLLHAAVDQVGPRVMDIGDGVRHKSVLVVGGGVIGLLMAALARWAGAAEVAVADATPERRALAEALGASSIDPAEGDVWRWCKDRWVHGAEDRGADMVFQCRGHDTALQMAFASARRQGTIIDLAFYDQGAPNLWLGREFHHNGLRHLCAQIGHLPRGVAPDWTMDRLRHVMLDFLRDEGDAIRRHLITDVLPMTQASDFIAAISDRRRHTVQAVFTGLANEG